MFKVKQKDFTFIYMQAGGQEECDWWIYDLRKVAKYEVQPWLWWEARTHKEMYKRTGAQRNVLGLCVGTHTILTRDNYAWIHIRLQHTSRLHDLFFLGFLFDSCPLSLHGTQDPMSLYYTPKLYKPGEAVPVEEKKSTEQQADPEVGSRGTAAAPTEAPRPQATASRAAQRLAEKKKLADSAGEGR